MAEGADTKWPYIQVAGTGAISPGQVRGDEQSTGAASPTSCSLSRHVRAARRDHPPAVQGISEASHGPGVRRFKP